jgi:two-component system phosphate regulon sensor histidine kinase PhoR
MRNRIFRRYFWSAFLLLALSFFVIDFYVIRFARDRRVERLQADLEAAARILAGEAAPNAAKFVRGAAERSGRRVTVIDPQGRILADSVESPISAISPSDAEFERATHGRIGSAIREISDDEVLFVAAPFPNAGGPGYVLRLSRSLAEANAGIAELWVRLLLITFVTLGASLALTWFFMRSFSRRIARLRTYIDGLPDASLPDDELPSGDDELGSLAQSLRRTAPKIRDLLDKLKLEGARREAILASMVEGVLAVDKELRVTFCNRSFARTMGARMPVPEGMPLLDLARDPALRDLLTNVLQTGEPVERRLQLRGVQAHSFEVQAAPLAGLSARGALAILHDVTELERLERVRKDFVANVSHELRTPLAAIRGYAETLLDGALEDLENNRKFVEIILAHAIRLNNIASDLLVISELESNAAGTQPKRLSIRAVIESALRTVESSARVCGVRLVTGKIEDFDVLGYEIRLEQAFVNLLDNAVKFNRPDGEVRVETAGRENDTATILISDTGIGIPSDDLPRIFERFYRVDKARSRAVGGTGLGLSIVRHVIEQMGGNIRVESQLGKGSRFTVVLPFVRPSA